MIPEADEIERELLALQERRDRVAELSREIIRTAGRTIALMHAKETARVRKHLSDLKGLVTRLRKIEKGLEYNSMQAHQEYVEACALYTIIREGRMPTRRELGESGIPYLLGMLDVVGELKREAFEAMMRGEAEEAAVYYGFMKEIHDSLLHMRFSSSLVQDFRKKQDVARIQIENAGSEILSFRKR